MCSASERSRMDTLALVALQQGTETGLAYVLGRAFGTAIMLYLSYYLVAHLWRRHIRGSTDAQAQPQAQQPQTQQRREQPRADSRGGQPGRVSDKLPEDIQRRKERKGKR